MGNTVEVTDWFDGDVEPVRKGLYQRAVMRRAAPHQVAVYSYWDGQRWSFNGSTPKEAYRDRKFRSLSQFLPWRGLAQEPKS